MNWLKNLKTSAKLLVGFGTMIVLLGTIVVIAYQTITAIRDSQQRLFEQDFADVVDMVELRADLNRQRARILEMLLTTNRPELDALAVDIHSRAKEVDQALQGFFGRHANDAQTLLKVEELKGLLTAYRQTREQQMTLIFAGKAEEARRTAESLQTDRFEKMRVVAVELGYHALARAKANLIKSNEDAARAVRMFTILAALAFLVGITMTAVLNRLIAGPLKELTAAADRIAAGDLSGNVSPEARNDEVGMLARTFERMTQSLREQMRQLAEGANVLGASASEIVASSTQLAASAAESAAAVSETATTVQEVRQTVDLASQKAKTVSDSAQRAAQFSQSGRKSTEEVVAGMTRIRQQMEAIAACMVRLSEQSQTIGQIVAAVEDLAAQSNLLAVNAAIEAAKAGEHGKGFGVVAQEVKRLAEQSRQATTQVRTILSDIQKATTAAVMATEQGGKAVEAGEKQTGAAGESIQALAGSLTEAAQVAIQIATTGRQQLAGMDQVATAMESIKQATSQNVASAKQLETAAGNLNNLGARLKQMVDKYKA